jgi:hypothetical protein
VAQRIVDNEQYESILIKGDENGGALSVKSEGKEATVVFSRPLDATAYAAGDAILPSGASYVTFSGIDDSGGDIYITNMRLSKNSSTVPAGMGALRLHLYSAAPSGVADNAAFTIGTDDISLYKGNIEVNTPIAFGAHIYRQNETANLQVTLASGATAIYGILQTANAYTPASGSTFRIGLSYFVV